MTETETPIVRQRIEAPAPGVYEGIPFATYAAWDAVNNSFLSKIIEASPMHAYDWLVNGEDDEEYYLIGRALHTLTLEGDDKYAAEFPIADQCAAEKKGGERCSNPGKHMTADRRWFCGVHKPKDRGTDSPGQFLLPDQDGIVRAMRKSLLDREDCRRFLCTTEQARNELSIIWIDADTSVKCKARIDAARPTWEAIGDLKTTRSASPRQFPRSIGEYGYYRQGAFYLDGAHAVGMDWAKHFFFFPVEKERPFAPASYQLAADAIELGRMEIAKALKIVSHCQTRNDWYGYESELELVSVKRWKAQEILSSLEH